MSDKKQEFTPEQIAEFQAYDNYLADKAHEESATAMYPVVGGGAGAAVGAAVGAGQEISKVPGAIKEAISAAKAPATAVVEGAPALTSGDKWARAIGGPGGVTQDMAVKNRAMQGALTPKEAAQFKVAREGIIVPNKTAADMAKVAQMEAKKLPAQISRGVQALGPIAPIIGKGLAVGSMGYDIGDVIDRANKGQYGRAAVSGLGALGSGASMVPHPIARIGGTAAATAAPFLNMYLDKLAKEHPDVFEQLHLAIGGLVGLK